MTPDYADTGHVPEVVPSEMWFDAITMLAVLEHLHEGTQAKLGNLALKHAQQQGFSDHHRALAEVDHILEVMMKLHLMSNHSHDEHHGFAFRETEKLFPEPSFGLLHKSKFELGLNNLCVFWRN